MTALVLLELAAILGCGDGSGSTARQDSSTFEVVRQHPHDRTAYTQGLVFEDSVFLESTGVRGQSTLRRVDVETGRVLQRVDLPAERFGEGVVALGDRVYQLTWTSGTGYIYDRSTLARLDSFSYAGEGWGLTTDGTALIMSDGTDVLRFLDPATFEVTRTLSVHSENAPLSALNELEWIRGEIWTNVYQSNWIVRIDPSTGEVTQWIDGGPLVPPEKRGSTDDVLNAIAYDAAGERIFITGKRWPVLYEVRVAGGGDR